MTRLLLVLLAVFGLASTAPAHLTSNFKLRLTFGAEAMIGVVPPNANMPVPPG